MKVSEAIDQLQVGDTVWVKGEVEYITKLGALPLALEFSETTKYFAESDEVMTANVFKEMEKYENRIGELERQIDEISLTDPSEKVKIPECVAEWIDFCQSRRVSIHTAMNECHDVCAEIQPDYKNMRSWLTGANYKKNEEIFAHAWLDGFTVEPKRWVVRHKDDCIYFEKFDEDKYDFSAIWTYLTEPPAFKFSDKSKAEAVATLVEGSVEEL